MGLEEAGVRLVAQDASNFQRDIGRSRESLTGFFDAAERGSGRINGFAEIAIGAFRRVGEMAVEQMFRAGQAITGFVSQGVLGAADLEAQLDGVQAVLGATAEEMVKLKGLTVDLGMDPNLKVTAVEAAEAIEMLARNGLNAEQILGGTAYATVLLANATGGTFAQSANIATDAMAIFGIEAENMGEAVNGIVSTTQNSKFSIDDYALALGQAGGVAGSVGVSFEDFNATIAAISPSFYSGSSAGTSFKNFLLRLIPQTKPAIAAMLELGLVTEDGANAFFDAEGNMKSMAEIAGILNEATRDLSEQQKNQAFATIFGNDAMVAAFELAGLTEEQFRDLQATMAQTDAVEAAATRVDNLRGALDIMQGVIEGVQLQIGDALIPSVRLMAETFTGFVSDNQDRIVGFFQTVGEYIGENLPRWIETGSRFFTETLAPAISTVAVWLGKNLPRAIQTATNFWDNTLAPAIDWARENFEAIKGAILGVGAVLGGALLMGAITSVVGLLGALVSPVGLLVGGAALLGAAWSENWGGIRDITAQVWEGYLQPAFATVADWLQVALPAALETASGFWTNTLQPALVAAGEWLAVNIPVAIQTLADYWDSALQPAITRVVDAFQQNMVPMFIEAGKWLQENLPRAIQTASDFWTNTLHPALMKVGDFIFNTVLPALANAYVWLFENIPVALQKASDFWNNTLHPALREGWRILTEQVIPAVSDAVIWLRDTLTGALQKASDFWNNVLQPALRGVWNFLETSIFPTFTRLVNTYLETTNTATGALGRVWEEVLKPALKAVWDFIDGSIFPLMVALRDVHLALVTKATEGLQKVWETMLLPALREVWGFIDRNIMPLLSDLTKFIVQEVDKSVKKHFIEPLNFLRDVIRDNTGPAIQWLKDNMLDPLVDSFKRISEAISGVIGWLGDLAAKISSIDFGILTPGSPTPFEIGLWGVGKAMRQLSSIEAPKLAWEMEAVVPDLPMASRGRQVVPPATPNQLLSRAAHSVTYERTVNFTGNYSSEPAVRDRNDLLWVLGTN